MSYRSVFIGMSCILLVSAVPVPAQKPAADAASESVEDVIRSYEAQEAAVEAEIAPQLASAKQKLISELRPIIDKLNATKKADDAQAIQKVLERFETHGIAPTERSSLPPVRTPGAAYARAVQAADASIALRRNSIRSKYMQALVAAERAARNRNDADAVKTARFAEQSLAIRQAIADPIRIASTPVAGRDRDPIRDVPKKGMPLIGFRGDTGSWFQFTVLGSLQPIFHSPTGHTHGTKRGNAGDGREIIAREGYAVGGIMVRSGEVVDGLQIIFMRLKADGLSLDPQDSYTSEWLGTSGGGARELSGKGRLVVGITGTTTGVIESLGLIHLR